VRALYDRIGRSYVATRGEDPRIAAAIWSELGDARTVLNVGAGAGAYEPRDRDVTAVEPSAVMRAQRPPEAAPCIDARAEALPFSSWRTGAGRRRASTPRVRANISIFALTPAAEVEAMVAALREDLASGEWARRNGALPELDEYDFGYRVLVAE